MPSKKILLVQFRDDISQEHEAKCFQSKLGLSPELFIIKNAILDEFDALPVDALDGVAAVIFGGSGQYDLSKNPEQLDKAIKNVTPLLTYILETDFPFFGVCFGHQLLCKTLGAKVLADETKAESGSKEITLTSSAKIDKLFEGISDKFVAQEGHKDSVVELPQELTLLGSSEKCENQIVRYKNNIYSMQFHPELSPDDIAYRWSLYPAYLKGKDVNEMKAALEDTPIARQLLQNFVHIYLN